MKLFKAEAAFVKGRSKIQNINAPKVRSYTACSQTQSYLLLLRLICSACGKAREGKMQLQREQLGEGRGRRSSAGAHGGSAGQQESAALPRLVWHNPPVLARG